MGEHGEEKEERAQRLPHAGATRKGLLMILTGDGKGKSTSAFGTVVRALGHGMQVGVVQFIKARDDTGEVQFFRRQPGVYWHLAGRGFTWESDDPERDKAAARHGWSLACKMLQDSSLDLVVLDELTYPLRYGWLDLETVLAEIADRPATQHVIVTGRGAPERLCEAADTVTEMKEVKHAFRSGVMAQPGIDF